MPIVDTTTPVEIETTENATGVNKEAVKMIAKHFAKRTIILAATVVVTTVAVKLITDKLEKNDAQA